ncbi:MAG: hypothetical protein ACJAT1_001145 [Marivirga sp.]|jgi:hypothetical protein
MKYLIYAFSLFLFCLVASCGTTEIKTIRTASVEMIEEYPMEGSNTLTGIWKVDLNGINIEDIKSAKVTAITLKMQEPSTSDLLAEITMQLAATGSDMQRVGILNPVPVEKKELYFTIAAEQENLLDLLMQEEITFVADVNLQEDLVAALSVTTEIEIELEVKQ